MSSSAHLSRGAPVARLHLSPARRRRAEVVRGGPPRRIGAGAGRGRRALGSRAPPLGAARPHRAAPRPWPASCSSGRSSGGWAGRSRWPWPRSRRASPCWPPTAGPGRARRAGPGDHLAVGVAQAAALVPGVSRAGAALTAGRACAASPARGAHARAPGRACRSRRAPIALKGTRMAREGIPEGAGPAMLGGALASLASAAAGAGGAPPGARTRPRTRRWPPTGWPSALAAAAVGGKHHGRKIPGAGPLSPLQ